MGRKTMSLNERRLMECKGRALKEVPPPRGIAKFNVCGSLHSFYELNCHILFTRLSSRLMVYYS